MVYIAHEAIALRLGDVGIVFSFLLFVLKLNKYLLHLSGGFKCLTKLCIMHLI